MDMKKSWTLSIALAAGLVLTAPAHAFLFDGFGDDQGPAEDTNPGMGVSDMVGPMAITDTDLVNATREIEANLTGDDGGSSVELTAGVGGNRYEHNQTDGEFGYSEIRWFFDSTSFNDPLNLLVDIRSNDTGGMVDFTLADGSGGDQTVTEMLAPGFTGGQMFTFDFTGVDMTDIQAGTLRITGNNSLDMSLEFIEVPAPGVLGLLGLGLAGLAFVARRRRNEDSA